MKTVKIVLFLIIFILFVPLTYNVVIAQNSIITIGYVQQQSIKPLKKNNTKIVSIDTTLLENFNFEEDESKNLMFNKEKKETINPIIDINRFYLIDKIISSNRTYFLMISISILYSYILV